MKILNDMECNLNSFWFKWNQITLNIFIINQIMKIKFCHVNFAVLYSCKWVGERDGRVRLGLPYGMFSEFSSWRPYYWTIHISLILALIIIAIGIYDDYRNVLLKVWQLCCIISTEVLCIMHIFFCQVVKFFQRNNVD